MLAIMLLLFAAVAYAVTALSLQRVAVKTQSPSAWWAWVPGLNLVLLCRCAGKTGWLTLLFFIPLLNFIILVYLCMALARAAGKSSWIGLCILVPGLNGLLLPYLAFSDEPWWQKHFKWALPAFCLGCLALAAGLAYSIMGTIKSSPAYQLALRQAQAAPALAEKIGAPLRPGWYVVGIIKIGTAAADRPDGIASLSFPISGPKGQATVLARAVRQNGEWRLTALGAKLPGTPQALMLPVETAPAAAAARPPDNPAPPPPSAPPAAAPATPAPPAPAAAASPAAAPVKPAAPIPTPAPQPSRPEAKTSSQSIPLDNISRACTNEIGLFCGDDDSGAGMIDCLRTHESDLLDPCKRELSAAGLWP